MPSEIRRLSGGGYAIVCSRGAPPGRPCASCGRDSGGVVCDYPVKRPIPEGKTEQNTPQEEWLKLTTCSRPTCRACGERIGKLDYCGPHVRMVRKAEEEARGKSTGTV